MKVRDYNKKDEIEVKKIFTKYWTDDEFLSELAKELDSDSCRFYVVEEEDEIIGIAGWRLPSVFLGRCSNTKKPAELYIIASKFQNRGIGNYLGRKIINDVRDLGFTEIVCFSPESHSNSWNFYEKLGFTKYGIVNDPDDGYPGMVWKKSL